MTQPASSLKTKVRKRANKLAPLRDSRFRLNGFYHEQITRLLKFYIPENSSILEIGCGTGGMLNDLHPRFGVGVDIGENMVSAARKQHPHLHFACMDAECLGVRTTFEYVIIVDTLGLLDDIQNFLKSLAAVVTPQTRVIFVFHNFLWQPALQLAELLHLKMAWNVRLNWVDNGDLVNMLRLENFDTVVAAKQILVPVRIPAVSPAVNTCAALLPGLNRLCFSNLIVTRKLCSAVRNVTVSVIVPARNEAGNIEEAVRRIPPMGSHTEILFVEGHSTDSTLQEMERVARSSQTANDIAYWVQSGTGKADAVREGFARAKGDILMILDADLTVSPEELPKFYDAIVLGRGEFINGSRLVYPLEKGSMRLLNIFGNKFFSIAFSWILGQPIKDTLCGTKVIHRKNWERIQKNRTYFGDFDPFGDFDLIFGAAKLGLKIVEIPIRYHARHYGVTNISRFRHGWLLLKMLFVGLRKIKFAR